MRKLKKHTELREPGIRWFVWAFLVALLVWFFWDMPNDEFSHTRSVWMVIIALGPGLIGGLLCYQPMYKRKKKARDEAVAGAIADGKIPVCECKARHLAGLPIPKGVPCEATVYGPRLELRAGGQNYVIPMERVINAQEYADTEMRQYLDSNFSSTLFGGLAFGEVGAIIGAMPKTKYRPAVSKWNVVVNFITKDGVPQAVVLTKTYSLGSLAKAVNQYARCTVQCGENGKIEL